MIDRNSPVPIYHQLKLQIKSQIEQGELVPGDRLPTEMELCEQYHISRAPVRQALTELAQEELIIRRPGQGSFIASLAAASLEQKTKIVILVYEDVRWISSLEEAVLIWNLKEPEREIELDIRMCSRSEFHQVLKRMTIQGDAPDIAPLDDSWITHYASEGYITPLNQLDPVWVDEICQDMELPVLKNNTVKGYLYAVPVQADIFGLWYRKDWFRYESIEPPATWSELLHCIDYFAASEVRQRLGHQYPIVLPVTSATSDAILNILLSFIWLSVGNVVENNVTALLDEPAINKALRFLRKITLDRQAKLPEDMYHSEWSHQIHLFAQGAVSMVMGGTNEWPAIFENSQWKNESDASRHIGFVMLPRPSLDILPIAFMGGTSWAIFSQSKVQKLCLELFKIAAAADISAAYCLKNGQISPHISANRYFLSQANAWIASIVPLLHAARRRPPAKNLIPLSNYVQSVFKQVLWDGGDYELAAAQISRALALVMSDVIV